MLVKTKTVELASELCVKFPSASTHALARMLYGQNKLLFAKERAALDVVRKVRGLKKTHIPKRGSIPMNKSLQVNLPEGITHFDDWRSYDIEGDAKIAVISDLHIPFHVKSSVDMAIKHLVKYKPTHVILNGDIVDFFAVSFWQSDPRKRDLANELNIGRIFIEFMRSKFPNAKIIYKLGNHEERWERWLQTKAPELLGVEDFEMRKLLRLEEHGVDLVTDMRTIKAGKLNIIHGHEFRRGISAPVNPARGLFLKGKENCLAGHSHQFSSHSEKSMNDSILSCWSVGCLCDLHPGYNILNSWSHGFATIDLEACGNFDVNPYKIVKDRIFHA